MFRNPFIFHAIIMSNKSYAFHVKRIHFFLLKSHVHYIQFSKPCQIILRKNNSIFFTFSKTCSKYLYEMLLSKMHISFNTLRTNSPLYHNQHNKLYILNASTYSIIYIINMQNTYYPFAFTYLMRILITLPNS